MTEQRKSISGGSEDSRKQLQVEVRVIPKEEQQKLLSEAGVGVEMIASQALAIKADLAIPRYLVEEHDGATVVPEVVDVRENVGEALYC